MLILAFLSAKNVATLLFLKSFSFVAGLAKFFEGDLGRA